jgi:hypothetical protein
MTAPEQLVIDLEKAREALLDALSKHSSPLQLSEEEDLASLIGKVSCLRNGIARRHKIPDKAAA